MTETIDELIRARFEAVANRADDSDWADVVGRVRSRVVLRGRRPSARLVAAAVAALAAATTAVAFGWPGRVVDFFQAPPAPQSVAHFFDTFNEAVPQNMSPHATVWQPREVMTATFDANNVPPTNPTEHTLYVAPRTDGGFCFVWTDAGGGCADPEDATAATTNPGARSLGASWFSGDYATVTFGYVRGDAQTVEARFADGTSVMLPVTWVSAPIDAGFFVYAVPPAHQTTSDALVSVVALDASGNVVGHDEIGVTKPLDQNVLQTLPDGTKESLPRRAQAARATEPFSFRTASGAHAYLWVMPRTGGGSCYLYGTGAGGGFGCVSPRCLPQMPPVNAAGAGGVYFAYVKTNVAALELRFDNGTAERLTPVDGYVLAQLPASAQLVATVARDRSGKAIFRQQRKGPLNRALSERDGRMAS